MIIAAIVQVLVCVLILRWLLKKKTGERFSKKTVVKFLVFGAIAVCLTYAVSFVLPIQRDTFFGMNPILCGFLTALITAAILEELAKYLMFRLAIRKNAAVVTWLDAIIAAVIVAIGFTLLEDVAYLSGGSILRAFVPAHLLFQTIMGYYYGKARVTKRAKYDVLSLVLPILAHTAFDMFIIAEMSILGDQSSLTGLTEESLKAMPNGNYLLPLAICIIAVFVITVVALIAAGRKIGRWSRNGEKQEALQEASA